GERWRDLAYSGMSHGEGGGSTRPGQRRGRVRNARGRPRGRPRCRGADPARRGERRAGRRATRRRGDPGPRGGPRASQGGGEAGARRSRASGGLRVVQGSRPRAGLPQAAPLPDQATPEALRSAPMATRLTELPSLEPDPLEPRAEDVARYVAGLQGLSKANAE